LIFAKPPKDYSMSLWRKAFISAFNAFSATGIWRGLEVEKSAEQADLAVIEYKKRIDDALQEK